MIDIDDQKELVVDLAFAIKEMKKIIEVISNKVSYTKYPKALELSVFDLNIALTQIKRKHVIAKKTLNVLEANT